MKLFSWMQKTFHHNAVKEGFPQNVKKTETVVNEIDMYVLLKKVDLDDSVLGWRDDILTIGTLGSFESLKPSNQNEYLVLESKEEEEEEEVDDEHGENYFHQGDHEQDEDHKEFIKDEELSPLMFTTLGHYFDHAGEISAEHVNEIEPVSDLSSLVEAYELKNSESNRSEGSEEDKKGKRITLADLFLADADVKMKFGRDKFLKQNSCKKTDIGTKKSLSFAKTLIPRVKDDAKNFQRMMRRMLKRKIHPEIDDNAQKSDGEVCDLGLITIEGKVEAFESVSLLPTAPDVTF